MVGTGFGDRTVTMLGSFTLARKIHSVITGPHLWPSPPRSHGGDHMSPRGRALQESLEAHAQSPKEAEEIIRRS